MKHYFVGEVDYDPTWMEAYYRTKEERNDVDVEFDEDGIPSPRGKAETKEEGETKELDGSDSPGKGKGLDRRKSFDDVLAAIEVEPDDPAWVHQYNEFVLLMQVPQCIATTSR